MRPKAMLQAVLQARITSAPTQVLRAEQEARKTKTRTTCPVAKKQRKAIKEIVPIVNYAEKERVLKVTLSFYITSF
jgi:hypothetical protein